MKKLPPIPANVFSILGDVVVRKVRNLKFDGEDALGSFNYGTREIKLRPEQPQLVAWQTLFHEKVHMWLSDSGVSASLTVKQEEEICDALSTMLLAEMLNSLPSSP